MAAWREGATEDSDIDLLVVVKDGLSMDRFDLHRKFGEVLYNLELATGKRVGP